MIAFAQDKLGNLLIGFPPVTLPCRRRKLKASFWTLVSSIYTQEEAAVPPSFHQTFLQQLAKAQRRLLF